jgi:hypothetical protein
MSKVFSFIVEVIAWLSISLSPAFLMGLAGLLIFENSGRVITWVIVFASAGFVAGCFWAERIRRKHGCSSYLSRISATPGLDDNMDRSK